MPGIAVPLLESCPSTVAGIMRDEFLTLEEAARLLHLGVDSIRRLIDSGDLPAAELDQKRVILLRDQLVEFIRTKSNEQSVARRNGTSRRVDDCRSLALPGEPLIAAARRQSRYREDQDRSSPAEIPVTRLPQAETLLTLPEVTKRVGLQKTAIYASISDGNFPAPVKVGGASRWVETEIQGWIAKMAAGRVKR